MSIQRGKSNVGRMAYRAHIIMTIPGLVAIFAAVIFPIAMVATFSLQDRSGYSNSGTFIGLKNFANLIQSSEFTAALKTTCLYALFSVGLQLILGLLSALALKAWNKGTGLLLSMLLLPYVLPTILVAVVWRWFLHESLGILNVWLLAIGIIDAPIIWYSQALVFMTLVIVSTWQFMPFVTMLCYASLVSIPNRRYETASINGLGPVRTFVRVTLPELRPVIMAVVLLRGLWMFTKFDTVWLLVGKDAVGKFAQTLPVLSYRLTFEGGRVGLGSAVAIFLLIVLVPTLIVFTWLVRSDKWRPEG